MPVLAGSVQHDRHLTCCCLVDLTFFTPSLLLLVPLLMPLLQAVARHLLLQRALLPADPRRPLLSGLLQHSSV
jgi:hypothetical protein